MRTTVKLPQGDIELTDEMVVRPEDFIPRGEYNPHNVRPWVIGAEFGAFAIVFADCEQDAIDTAIDEGKMDFLKVSDADLAAATEDERSDFLTGGNASESLYQDYLWMEELPTPAFSFIRLLTAGEGE